MQYEVLRDQEYAEQWTCVVIKLKVHRQLQLIRALCDQHLK